MAQPDINQFVCALGTACERSVLEEKWLLAPSRRVGFQWLDSVTRSGQPVLNVRVKTLQALALELATPILNRTDVVFLRGIKAEVLIERIFRKAKKKDTGYLSKLEPSIGLLRTLGRSVRDL